MNPTFKIIAFFVVLSVRLFSQEMVLNTYNGTFHVSKLEKTGNRFEYIKIDSKRKLFIHELKVFSYTSGNGVIQIVTDSAIYSRKKKFNKSYTNLKPISNKNFHSLLYNDKIVISEKDFTAILKNLKKPEVQSRFIAFKRNKKVKTALFVLSGSFVAAGIAVTLIGLSNSSGRNSYTEEKRRAAAVQTNTGLGLIAVGLSLSVSSAIINLKNHRLLRKELVPLYNQNI